MVNKSVIAADDLVDHRSTQYSVLSTRGPSVVRDWNTANSIAIEHLAGKGRGVIALRNFCAGETIERPSVIVVPREEVQLLKQTCLGQYYFEWGEDCDQGAIALGCGSLYNHSYTPNARYDFVEGQECLEFTALRDIQAGEEITINYNNLGGSAADPVKFDVR